MAKRRMVEKTEGNGELAACGCGACAPGDGERKAAGVDPEAKAANLARLSRIEGQVRGLKRMVEEDRYCPDILVQVMAVQEALRGVSRELVRNHLKHCVTSAVRAGKEEDLAEMFEDLADLFHRSGR